MSYINIEKFLPLRSDVEHNTIHWSRQGDTTDEKSDEDDVREDGREVGHLPRARHAFPEREEEQDVARGQATDQTEYCSQFHQLFMSSLFKQMCFVLINDKNHLRSSVPCLQTSLYRSLWVVYQVHWPLITGRPNGLGSQGSCKVYRSLFTDPP